MTACSKSARQRKFCFSFPLGWLKHGAKLRVILIEQVMT